MSRHSSNLVHLLDLELCWPLAAPFRQPTCHRMTQRQLAVRS